MRFRYSRLQQLVLVGQSLIQMGLRPLRLPYDRLGIVDGGCNLLSDFVATHGVVGSNHRYKVFGLHAVNANDLFYRLFGNALVPA